MTRVLQLAVLALLLTVAAFAGFGCWGIYHCMKSAAVLIADSDAALKAATATEQKAAAVADNLNGVLTAEKPLIVKATANLVATSANLKAASAGIDVAVTEINRPCGQGDSCGTIATTNRALNSVRMAAGQVTAISEKEKDQRVAMNNQETQLASEMEAGLTKMGVAIDGLTVLEQHASGVATNIEATTGDLQVRLHPILNPAPCQTRGCRFKRDLGAVKAVGPGAEGLYYLIQVFRDVF